MGCTNGRGNSEEKADRKRQLGRSSQNNVREVLFEPLTGCIGGGISAGFRCTSVARMPSSYSRYSISCPALHLMSLTVDSPTGNIPPDGTVTGANEKKAGTALINKTIGAGAAFLSPVVLPLSYTNIHRHGGSLTSLTSDHSVQPMQEACSHLPLVSLNEDSGALGPFNFGRFMLIYLTKLSKLLASNQFVLIN